MIIRTKRLKLRPFKKEDINWYKEFAKNEEVQKRLPNLAADKLEKAEFDIKVFTDGDFVNDFYYVVCDRADNVLGVIIAVRITNMTIDVSYFLEERYRHKGYMQEALEVVVNLARNINPLYRFRLVINEDNISSLNVAKSLGATITLKNGKYICYV